MVFGFHHISLFSTRESSLTQKIEPELTKFSLFSTECERCRIDSHSDIHLHRSLVCDLFSTSLQASDESCRLCDCNYLAHCTPLQFTWILCTSHLYPTTEIWCSIIHTMHNQLDWRARNEIMHHKGGVSLHVSCTLFLWKLSQFKLNITLTRLPLVLMSFAYMLIVRVLWRSDTIPGHVKKKAYCTRSIKLKFFHVKFSKALFTHISNSSQTKSSNSAMANPTQRRLLN